MKIQLKFYFALTQNQIKWSLQNLHMTCHVQKIVGIQRPRNKLQQKILASNLNYASKINSEKSPSVAHYVHVYMEAASLFVM